MDDIKNIIKTNLLGEIKNTAKKIIYTDGKEIDITDKCFFMILETQREKDGSYFENGHSVSCNKQILQIIQQLEMNLYIFNMMLTNDISYEKAYYLLKTNSFLKITKKRKRVLTNGKWK